MSRSRRAREDETMVVAAGAAVVRRSARLTAKAFAAAPTLPAPRSPSPEVISVKRVRVTAKLSKKEIHIVAKAKASSPKRGKIPAYFGPQSREEREAEAKKAMVIRNTILAARETCQLTGEILAAEESPKAEETRNGRLLKSLPSRDLENELWAMGYENIAGVDEAGRGPLAGPVVAAACIIPSSVCIEGINDSKKLSEKKREELFVKLTTTPGIKYAVHIIDAEKIDEVNILEAAMLAMNVSVCRLMIGAVDDKAADYTVDTKIPDFVLVDGNRLPRGIPESKGRTIVKGDGTCQVIAAASILAKVSRDRLMTAYDEKWPMYGFKGNKGYGTAEHVAALRKHGPCDIHRRSFAPLKDLLEDPKFVRRWKNSSEGDTV